MMTPDEMMSMHDDSSSPVAPPTAGTSELRSWIASLTGTSDGVVPVGEEAAWGFGPGEGDEAVGMIHDFCENACPVVTRCIEDRCALYRVEQTALGRDAAAFAAETGPVEGGIIGL
jgi:hypothetical protein